MKRTKRILSAITALAITASAFASMVIPASAEADPAGVIDFTNRTLEATEKGNATTFSVEAAASSDTKLNAAGLAAADAGNVLKLGSNASGGDKLLGYTAPLLVDGGNVAEYSGQVKLSFKLEPIQVRNDKDASMVVQFSDISKQNVIFPITVHTGNAAKMEVNGQTVNTEYGKYYVVEETLDFDNKTGSVTVKDSGGTALLSNSTATLTASNLAYLYYSNTAWNYGNCAIDDITLDATQIGTPVYYNAVVNTTRYAKMVTSDNKTYYADVNGKLTIPLIKPNTTFTYTLSKEGYTSVEGEIAVTDADVTQSKPLTLADSSTLFIESEFGNENEAYVSAGGSRNDTISLGEFTLPEMSQISVDFNFAGFGGQGGQQKTWDIVTDGGKLVGIQINDNGMFAWTDWTGTDNMNQQSDTEAYTNNVRLGDVPSGDFTIDFVVGTEGKGITVLYNNTVQSLSYTINATKITGLATGLYRYNGSLSTKRILVTTPDEDFMSIVGPASFAKIYGQDVEKTYDVLQTVIVSGETFDWTVSRSDGKATTGITVDDGVLTVEDTAEPGTITLTCQGSSSQDKKAELSITIADFQKLDLVVDGPQAYTEIGDGGVYYIVSAKDSFNEDIVKTAPPTEWTSSNPDVATIDSETGVLETLKEGKTLITVTVTNGTEVSTASIPVTVAKYYITADATGAKTTVDVTGIVTDSVKEYLVTTADADGDIVSQEKKSIDDFMHKTSKSYFAADAGVVFKATYDEGVLVSMTTPVNVAKGDKVDFSNTTNSEKVFFWDSISGMKPVELTSGIVTEVGGEIEFDTEDAAKIEIAPVFETTMNTTLAVPADSYNITATASNAARSDLYVNDVMVMNNVNQGSDNYTIQRVLAASTDYTTNDVVIPNGYAKFNYRDDKSSGTLFTKIVFSKSPSIVTRVKRVYVIGDSLTANYYGNAPEGTVAGKGDFPKANLVRTGWGQVLQNYIQDAEVTNLGNSGAWATGMLSDAFTQVKASAQAGDVVLWESGYNDKAHSTVDAMNAAITEAVEWCVDNDVNIYLITPNASNHDYKADVAWSAEIRTLAEKLDTPLIDLAADSYAFLNGRYGSLEAADTTKNIVGTYTGTTEDKITFYGLYNNPADTLHSTYNAANCWAAIVAEGLIGTADEDIVDTTYEYKFNDYIGEVTVSAGSMLSD